MEDAVASILSQMDQDTIWFFVIGCTVGVLLVIAAVTASSFNFSEVVIRILFIGGMIAVALALAFMLGWFLVLRDQMQQMLQAGDPPSMTEFMLAYTRAMFTSKALAIEYFSVAVILLISVPVARWLFSGDDSTIIGVLGIGALVLGLIFSLGFLEVLRGVSLILGIIGTIVGILVGLKKLAERKEPSGS